MHFEPRRLEEPPDLEFRLCLWRDTWFCHPGMSALNMQYVKVFISCRNCIIDFMAGKIGRELIGRLFSVVMFIVLTVVGLLFSIYLIYLAKSLYMYILAFSFTILAAISGFFNIFTSYSYYRSYLYDAYLEKIQKGIKKPKRYPAVAVVMPVFNEDSGEVKKNMRRLMQLDYPRNKLEYYLLDDSTDEGIMCALEKFSAEYGIHYIRRDKREGFKAGALNNMLIHSNEEYIAIFDYDEYLTNTRFLKDLIPYFGDKRLAYIQTEKKYHKDTFFSDTVDLFDAFFFKFIQPSRALNNTAIFAGSCGVIRRSHLKAVGGFPEYVIEDTFFSFESDVHGYKSLYIPKVYALGKPIRTFTELVKQQWRYNYGDTQFLSYFFRRSKAAKKRSLSPLSNIDYMTHGFGLNYISIVLLLFTVLSIFIVFSQLKFNLLSLSLFLKGSDPTWDLEMLGATAFSLSILAPVILTKIYFKSVRKGIMIFLLNFSLAFIRTRAAIAAIFKFSHTRILWERERQRLEGYKKLIYALKNSALEMLFSIILLSLAALAMMVDNTVGGLWLAWYGVLYVSTLFMFYKYG